MGKIILGLLIAPLLFTSGSASANENKDLITESSDKDRTQSPQGRNDSQGSPAGQNRVGNWDSQRQHPQMQQPQMQQPQMQQPQMQQHGNQEFRKMQSESGVKDPGTQSPQDRNDSKGSPAEQNRGGNWDSQSQQTPMQQHGNQEFREKQSENFPGREKNRDSEQSRDSNDQKKGWGSDKRNEAKTSPDGFDDKSRNRLGNGREQISKERLKEKEIFWQSKGREWRKNFSNYKTQNHIFDDQFWDHFRRRNNNWHFDNNFQWYSGANWSRIVVWLPWQWSRPVYYFYETNGDIYYSTTEDFSSLTPVDSKETFIAQAAKIANGQYPISNQQSDWMPLGMFTLAPENDSSEMPKRYLSLAISKAGAVTGAYFDSGTNTTLEIKGGIDPISQRIAWKFDGNDWPIMESGLYNLTKEESTLLIHTSGHNTEPQLIIRLNN